MKDKLVVSEYEGISVTFTEEGWFNATEIAGNHGKRPVDWVRLDETQAYIQALASALGISEPKSLIRAKRNSGTWLHPKLAVRFAQWLDVRFAVWCDLQIHNIITSKHPHFDWKRARHEAAATHKVAMSILQATRADEGKETKPHHYSNEARLINWALTGEFKSVDRANLSYEDLDLLAKIEERDAVLIGRGASYEKRKVVLEEFVKDIRMAKDFPHLIKEVPSLYALQK